jgi:4-hydroxy-2-oxoheptanedioate aldolase
MQFIRKRVLAGEVMLGIGANLGSSLTVEMIGAAGFDWTWIDCEHGAGDYSELIPQIQAASIHNSPAIVRIAWNEAPRFKRVLDLGAAGIMVPYVTSAREAELAAAAMRYPPEGIRGVARFNRACGFGQDFDTYFKQANDNLLTVVQIETRESVDRAEEIAAVAGVDVSVNMSMAQNFEHPEFEQALDRVAAACRQHGKAAGILLPKLDYLADWIARGYTFLVVGSDGGCVAGGLKSIAAACSKYRK